MSVCCVYVQGAGRFSNRRCLTLVSLARVIRRSSGRKAFWDPILPIFPELSFFASCIPGSGLGHGVTTVEGAQAEIIDFGFDIFLGSGMDGHT